MGLRESARQFLKRVIGESSYETLRHALRDGPDGVLKRGRQSPRTLSSRVPPFLERFKGSTADLPLVSGTQRKITESEAVKNSPICCNKFLATDTLQINYLSKTGESSFRMIRTEEVYEYDDEVFVVRALTTKTSSSYSYTSSVRIIRKDDSPVLLK